MSPIFQHSVLLLMGLLFALVAAEYSIRRWQGICIGVAWREAMIWGGGFIIYGVLDYFVLMR